MLGGALPVNTGGGLLSRGHPVGATGVLQIVELVAQLRGRAGERQVDLDPRLALAQNAGRLRRGRQRGRGDHGARARAVARQTGGSRRETTEEENGMTDYDPRTDTGIPTEPVGSLPRPAKLQAGLRGVRRGQDLQGRSREAAGRGVRRTRSSAVRRRARRSSPTASSAGRRLRRTRSPTRWPVPAWPTNLGPGGQFFAIFADGHGRQLPKLVGGPLKYNFYAADTLAKSLPYATKPMKQAVIAPSMLALLYPLKDPVEGYTREEFEEDIVQECVTDIRKAFEAGAARVSIDFTEGRLATREDPRNPWTGAGLLPHFIELNNRVLANFSDEERTKIGIHTCPGGDRDSVHSADVPYNNLLPEMFKINAGYFLIQLASEREKDPIYESIGQHSRDDQMCYIGVTVDAVTASGERAGDLRHDRARRGLHPQGAPRHDRRLRLLAVLDRREAQPRLAGLRARDRLPEDQDRVEGTRMAAEKLGVS